ncbi:MAG: PAS domain S-box-containing protein [Verrucomicrobiales bacterium]|jgi:PAS domain S-box-containing protein
MVVRIDENQPRKRALVVQRDEDTRRLICTRLTDRGFAVDSCATFDEGRATYRAQQLVVAPTEPGTISPNGFIAWVRSEARAKPEGQPPYILAIGDRETTQNSPTPNQEWDELITTPLDGEDFTARLATIDSWLENRVADAEMNRPQLDPGTTRVAIRPLRPPPKPQTPKMRVPPPPRPTKTGGNLVDPATLLARRKLKRHLPPPPRAPGLETQKQVPPPAAAQPGAGAAKPIEDTIFEAVPVEPAGQTAQLQALIDNAPIAMALFDREMRYLVLNQRWLADFGLVGANLIGRSHLEVFPSLGPAWQRVYTRALQGKSEHCEEDLWVRQDGSQDWVRWDVKPWIGADGQIAGITITCEVINEMIAHQRGGLDAEAGRSLLRGKVTPVLSIDLEGHVESASEACLAYLPGTETFAIKGEFFWEVFSLDPGRDKLKRDFLAAARETREGERFAFPPSWSHPARLATGGRTVLVWANSPRYDADGRVCGVLCIGITQGELAAPPAMRKPIVTEPQPLAKAETDTTRQMAARPEQLLEQASFGIILLDRDRNTLYANPEHSRLLGFDVRDYKDVEEWLAQSAPETSHGVLVLESWRENVWQKQVTKTLTLRNREKALRQIEFRPRPTADGGLMLTLFDVTEKRRGEEALRASEAKFRALFQHAGVGIALEDRSGNFFDVNPVFERMVAAQRHEIRKSHVRDWIHPEDWPQILANLENRPNGAAAMALEIRLNQKSGGLLWSRTTISRIVDHNGRSIFTAYFFHDITNERRADATLKAAHREHRALLGAIPDLILMLDRKGRLLDMIPSATGALIQNSATSIGQPLSALIPAFGESVPQLIERAAKKDSVSVFEFNDAENRHFKARFVRCSDDRFVAVIQDETAGKRASQAMQRHSLAFEHNCEGIVITDLTGKITDFNDTAERIFGYPRGEILGHTLSTLFSPTDRPSFNRRVADSLSGGKWAETTSFRRPDGSEGRCEVFYVAVAEDEERPAAIIGVNREISPYESASSRNLPGRAAADRTPADLQTLIKLIGLHLSFAGSAEMRFALRQNQERIRAIALIHQLLNSDAGPGGSRVNMAAYLKMLRRALLQNFNIAPEDIVIRLTCPEDAILPASQALSIGLITSEFLAETLQDACNRGGAGSIAVSLTIFKSFIEFRIEDDGLGIPDNLKTLSGSNLSMEVIKSLSEQLDAEMSLIANPQSALSLRFPAAPA